MDKTGSGLKRARSGLDVSVSNGFKAPRKLSTTVEVEREASISSDHEELEPTQPEDAGTDQVVEEVARDEIINWLEENGPTLFHASFLKWKANEKKKAETQKIKKSK